MQRKVFRVERMLGGHAAARPAAAAHRDHAGSNGEPVATDDSSPDRRELALLQDTVARNKRELATLISDGHERRMAHAAAKLAAAVEGMEKATVKILRSSEVIDDSARALAAAMKTDYERGLAQDIQEHVVKIYEACNFQDLAGQRIGTVIATLTMIEDRIADMLARSKGEAGTACAVKTKSVHGLINGPRLDGASGHTSQSDIDLMFD